LHDVFTKIIVRRSAAFSEGWVIRVGNCNTILDAIARDEGASNEVRNSDRMTGVSKVRYNNRYVNRAFYGIGEGRK